MILDDAHLRRIDECRVLVALLHYLCCCGCLLLLVSAGVSRIKKLPFHTTALWFLLFRWSSWCALSRAGLFRWQLWELLLKACWLIMLLWVLLGVRGWSIRDPHHWYILIRIGLWCNLNFILGEWGAWLNNYFGSSDVPTIRDLGPYGAQTVVG